MPKNTFEKSEFFRVGGTLHLDTPSYVERPADKELFEQVCAGQFCYVLTSRQMGKSSLMLRTAARLRQKGASTAIIDLSSLGSWQITAEQWYLGLMRRLAFELGLAVDPDVWWRQHATLTPVQRFTDFLPNIILTQIKTPVIIFIDEIDSTLKLPFTDDFFAAIRFCFNSRAMQSEYDRVTFVLLGVALPTELIQDRQRTPFNIGRAINLKEFSREDALPLQAGLEKLYPGQGQGILDWIFTWTHGHPYLTQKLCRAIAEAPVDNWSAGTVEQLVDRLFFSEAGRKEDNLQFVRSNIERHPDRRSLLRLYQRVYRGETVKEDERSPLQNRLKLIGLVRPVNRTLQVRNEIYRRVFDLAWVKENTPVPWMVYITWVAVVLSVVAIVFLATFTRWQQQQALQVKMTTYIDRFNHSADADIRLYVLAGLCQLNKQMEAQVLFFELGTDQQLEIFRQAKVQSAGDRLVTVVDCLYPAVSVHVLDDRHRQALMSDMCCALYRWDVAAGRRFSQQIGQTCGCESGGESEYE